MWSQFPDLYLPRFLPVQKTSKTNHGRRQPNLLANTTEMSPRTEATVLFAICSRLFLMASNWLTSNSWQRSVRQIRTRSPVRNCCNPLHRVRKLPSAQTHLVISSRAGWTLFLRKRLSTDCLHFQTTKSRRMVVILTSETLALSKSKTRMAMAIWRASCLNLMTSNWLAP